MLVRFEVLIAQNIKIMIIWDLMVFSLVDMYQHFVEIKMEAAGYSEMFTPVY